MSQVGLTDKVVREIVREIRAERERQINSECYSTHHDDEHDGGALALAAVCYATPVLLFERQEFAAGWSFTDPWPWPDGSDKRFGYGSARKNPGNVAPDPSTYTKKERRDLLVKAAALLVAEIERLDRSR